MVAMSSAEETDDLARRGKALQRAREAARLSDPESPVHRFITEADACDWTTPREFDVDYSQPLLIAAAAKRRRLTSFRMAHSFRTFTSEGAAVGGQCLWTTSLVSDLAKRASRSRPLAKAYLKAMDIPTPRARSFSAAAREEAWSWAAELPRGAVLKPATGRWGVGVSWGVGSQEAFHAAWEYALASRTNPLFASREILVEEHVTGLDVRVFVVGEEVVGALARLPLFIRGDGHSTVRGLAEAAVDVRAGNRLLAEDGPDVDDEALRELLLDPAEVLAHGEIRAVSGSANPRGGGITVDITDQLDAAHRKTAVDALWAMPGLKSGGVDLVVPDMGSHEPAVVVDVRDDADLALHRCPSFGTGRRVADAVVSQMIQRARR